MDHAQDKYWQGWLIKSLKSGWSTEIETLANINPMTHLAFQETLGSEILCNKP